jgi:hypothetical protein
MPPEDLYLHSTINRHTLPEATNPPPPSLKTWTHYRQIKSITLSGSRAKSTALRDSDLDFFIALNTPDPLPEIQRSLADHVHGQIRNVSVRIIQNNVSIDLVPSQNNTLWQSRHNTYLKTDVLKQIAHIRESAYLNEIRALKIWRRRNALRFPSFLLELAAIQASRSPQISQSFLASLDYLATTFPTARIVDPANPANIVSDLLTPLEKHRISQAASISLTAKLWPEII